MQPRRTSSFGRQPVDALAVEGDRALGDLAALGAQQVGDRLQRRRLAGAVGAEQRDDAALAARSSETPFSTRIDVVVDDLDVVDGEDGVGRGHRLPRIRRGRCSIRRLLQRRQSPAGVSGSPVALTTAVAGSVRFGQPAFFST